jgi:hypothetical protein
MKIFTLNDFRDFFSSACFYRSNLTKFLGHLAYNSDLFKFLGYLLWFYRYKPLHFYFLTLCDNSTMTYIKKVWVFIIQKIIK